MKKEKYDDSLGIYKGAIGLIIKPGRQESYSTIKDLQMRTVKRADKANKSERVKKEEKD